MLNADQFKKLFPQCADSQGWVNALSKVLQKYDINTPKRCAAFLAQCGHESGGWRIFSENLNYSAQSLNVVFPKYFKNAGRNSQEYHRQPEKIANVVYGNRMGNTSPGDGWKYRGRGPIQLTGKDNYRAFSQAMKVQALENPDIVSSDKEVAVLSAVWFWNKNNLNSYADKEDIKGMTKIINGGYNGLEDRIHHYNEAIHLLKGPSLKAVDTDFLVGGGYDDEVQGALRVGSRGEGVRLIQTKLGVIPQDGIFGIGTERIVKEFQSKNGLLPDGTVGPITLEKILGN